MCLRKQKGMAKLSLEEKAKLHAKLRSKISSKRSCRTSNVLDKEHVQNVLGDITSELGVGSGGLLQNEMGDLMVLLEQLGSGKVKNKKDLNKLTKNLKEIVGGLPLEASPVLSQLVRQMLSKGNKRSNGAADQLLKEIIPSVGRNTISPLPTSSTSQPEAKVVDPVVAEPDSIASNTIDENVDPPQIADVYLPLPTAVETTTSNKKKKKRKHRKKNKKKKKKKPPTTEAPPVSSTTTDTTTDGDVKVVDDPSPASVSNATDVGVQKKTGFKVALKNYDKVLPKL